MERTQLHSDRGEGRSERENFGKEDEGALTQEGRALNCRGERQETLAEVHRTTTCCLGNHAIS